MDIISDIECLIQVIKSRGEKTSAIVKKSPHTMGAMEHFKNLGYKISAEETEAGEFFVISWEK